MEFMTSSYLFPQIVPVDIVNDVFLPVLYSRRILSSTNLSNAQVSSRPSIHETRPESIRRDDSNRPNEQRHPTDSKPLKPPRVDPSRRRMTSRHPVTPTTTKSGTVVPSRRGTESGRRSHVVLSDPYGKITATVSAPIRQPSCVPENSGSEV